jgi:hypothetical protein
MLNLLTAIRDRMERRGRGNSITGSATRRETQAAPPSGVQGTWFVRAEVQELTPNSPRLDQLMIGLKADGAKVIGWLLYGAQPAPITDGKIEGNAVTFKVDGRLAGTYTAKLEGDRLVLRTTTGPLSSRALTAVRYRVGRDQ